MHVHVLVHTGFNKVTRYLHICICRYMCTKTYKLHELSILQSYVVINNFVSPADITETQTNSEYEGMRCVINQFTGRMDLEY